MSILCAINSILLPLISLFVGLFIFLKPTLIIEMQRKFYEKINWKIEPISMSKEIRNTRLMGMLLIVITLLTFIFMYVRVI
jgi:hypothetical protein